MRLALICFLWLLAGCVVMYFVAPPLFDAWFWMGWRAPIAEWLAAYGPDRIAGLWGLVWVRMVDGSLLLAAGLAAGLVAPRRAGLMALCFAVGFVSLPWVLYPASLTSFGVRVTIHVLAMDSAMIALCVGTALAIAGIRRRRHKRGFRVVPNGGSDSVSPPVSTR